MCIRFCSGSWGLGNKYAVPGTQYSETALRILRPNTSLVAKSVELSTEYWVLSTVLTPLLLSLRSGH